MHLNISCLVFFLSFLISAGYDYKITTHIIVFEPSDEMTSQQQCLEIEIINDSLPEDWEVFTLLLSTNDSAVNLTLHQLFMYISPNNGKWVKGISWPGNSLVECLATEQSPLCAHCYYHLLLCIDLIIQTHHVLKAM